MMKKKLRFIKIVCSLLVTAMIFCNIPFSAVAEIGEIIEANTGSQANEEIGNESTSQENTIDQTADNISSTGEVQIFEREDLREENVKHFVHPDGSYEAVVYSSPVHRKDENGKWQDIDNRLYTSTTGAKNTYLTADGRIEFSQNPKGNDGLLYKLRENGYTITMSLAESNSGNSSASVKNHKEKEKPQKSDSNESRYKKLKNIDNKTQVVYNNVVPHVNIEYELIANTIKEYIVVEKKCDSYTYSFNFTVEGLVAVAEADGSIGFYDSDTNKLVYVIPAPFMVDAKGTVSYSVEYKLTDKGDGTYNLVVEAAPEWIESDEREFPIKIDPSITEYEMNDTYVSSGDETANFGSNTQLVVGGGNIAYIQFPVHSFPEGTTIDEAYMSMNCERVTTDTSVFIFDVWESWDQDTLTYETASDMDLLPSSSNYLYDYALTADPEDGICDHLFIPITDLVDRWADFPSSNSGLGIGLSSGETLYISSSEHTGYGPEVIIYYSIVIPDGVYAMENVLYDNSWMDFTYGYSLVLPLNLRTIPYSTSPIESFSRSSLFKISNVPGTYRYVVRSMLNNRISPYVSGDTMFFAPTPANDADVGMSLQFFIDYNNDGTFSFRHYNCGSYQLAATGTSTKLTTVDMDVSTDARKWRMVKYTGEARYGGGATADGELIAGQTQTITAYSWSTEIGYNIPSLDVSSEYSSVVTAKTWDPETYELAVYTHTKGTFCVDITIENATGQWKYCEDVEEFETTLPMAEGRYLIENSYFPGHYLTSSGGSSAYLLQDEFSDFDGYQTWELIHYIDGQYTIKNLNTGEIAMASGYENWKKIYEVIPTSTMHDEMLWEFVECSSGTYKIVPALDEYKDFVIIANSSTVNECILVRNQDDETTTKDEWYFYSMTISLVNYYDGSFDDAKVDLIEKANLFAATVYDEIFGLQLVCESITEYESCADLCKTGDSNPCLDWDNYCGSDCYSGHHKNISRISDQIYNQGIDKNHIYITWANRDITDYCKEKNGIHSPIESGIGVVIGTRPIINFLSFKETTYQEECFYTQIIHEIAHTLGLGEFYNIEGNEHAIVDQYFCVMQQYIANLREEYCDGLKINPSGALCNTCTESMKELILTKIKNWVTT